MELDVALGEQGLQPSFAESRQRRVARRLAMGAAMLGEQAVSPALVGVAEFLRFPAGHRQDR